MGCWEQSSVPGSVTNGGEAKPSDGGADTLDQMARDLKEATPHCDALALGGLSPIGEDGRGTKAHTSDPRADSL